MMNSEVIEAIRRAGGQMLLHAPREAQRHYLSKHLGPDEVDLVLDWIRDRQAERAHGVDAFELVEWQVGS